MADADVVAKAKAEDGSELSHPALPLMRQFLQASAEARAAGHVVFAGVAATVAAAAGQEVRESSGDSDSKGTGKAAGYGGAEQAAVKAAQASCVSAVDKLPPAVVAGLAELWVAISDEEQPLGREEVEELVLAHLCEYPPFLADVILEAPLHQVAVGQGIMAPGDRAIDVAEVSRRLAPRLERHRPAAAKAASEACEALLGRSETLAYKLFNRLDLDRDGAISRDEFLQAAAHGLALEVENVAIAAGVQFLLRDPEFADDFHTAMAGGMDLVP